MGRQRKYTKELLAPIVEASKSYRDVVRKLGMTPPGNISSLVPYIQEYGLSTTHFTGQRWRKGVASPKRLPPEKILVISRSKRGHKEKTEVLRRAMIDSGIPYVCIECGQRPVWNGKALVLQIDHVDGNHHDCRKKNVRFLCPNCHTQTETFCSKNRRRYDRVVKR